MTKTTKTVLSVAILGVGGYLLWKNFKKPSTSTTSFVGNMGMGPRSKFFAGSSSAAAATVVGKRVQMSGYANYANTLGGNVIEAQGSGWVRGQGNVMPNTGANGAPSQFFDIHSSGWVRS